MTSTALTLELTLNCMWFCLFYCVVWYKSFTTDCCSLNHSFRQGWNSPFLREPSSFWEQHKLVHLNCMKHFKMKMFCSILSHLRILLTLTFLLSGSTLFNYYWYFLWLDNAFNAFSIWYAREMISDTFLITILLNLCVQKTKIHSNIFKYI